MAFARLFGLAWVPLLAVTACGGSTDESGGSKGGGGSGGVSGGSGGANSGGGSGGAMGGIGGIGGSGGCGGGGAADCVDPCTNQYSSPVCENGHWTCKYTGCADAGLGGSATGGNSGFGGFGGGCAANQVPTVDGCLGCSDATLAYTKAIDAARTANATCSSANDCVLTSASTTCAGACQVAVSSSGQAAFQAALAKIDADYCSGFVAVCGYSTPKCAVPTLACPAGLCEMVFN